MHSADQNSASLETRPLDSQHRSFGKANRAYVCCHIVYVGNEELVKTIVANDKVLHVTDSCWFALGQLRLNCLCKYYWIDAICINQKDDVEKSAQVDFMDATYRVVECGVVALGRHNRASQYLFQQLPALSFPREYPLQENGSGTGDSQPLQARTFSEASLGALDPICRERLSTGMLALAMRPYWNRLWIAQEFALPPRIVLCCGNSCVNF